MSKLKNKILYIINADWYFDLHWLERAIHFRDLGYEIHIAMPVTEDSIFERLSRQGLSIHPVHIERTSMSVLKEICILNKLRKIISTISPDLIHSVTIKPNLYATILCKYLKIPLVSTYAGLGTLGVSQNLKYRIARKVIFAILKKSSRSQCNYSFFENEEDLNLLCNEGVIPYSRSERVFGAGINLEYFSFSSYDAGKQQLTVLFASRLLKNKGLSLLFESVKELQNKGVNIVLRIAGIFDSDSPFAYTVEEIEAMASYPYVEWLGKRDDIKELIADCDVVCLPTTYGEGVPRILIEACAVGRPVITTPLGGCKDICINDFNGFLVEPNSQKSISEALYKVSRDPRLINELGINGRKLVESKFSNQIVFKQHKDKYELLLEKNGARK